MSANAYELLALAMRYVFAGLIVLIVARAWYGASVDSQRATKLRRLSPDTGIIGEFLVTDGGERAKPGMRYPVTLEGTIGSNRRADIRIRHGSIRGRHAIYQRSEEGLFVRGHASIRIGDGRGRFARELLLQDGDHLQVGKVTLMLVLTDGGSPDADLLRRKTRKRHSRDGRNEVIPAPLQEDVDELFRTNPAGEDQYDEGDAYDEFDAYDEYDEF